MFSVLIFAVLCTSCLAAYTVHYSISIPVGSGHGYAFATAKDFSEGKITGIRVWEIPNGYITGIQVRNGHVWTRVFGRRYYKPQELILSEEEGIRQIAGKFNPKNHIYQLIVMTSRGRFLMVGQPAHVSYNFLPTHEGCELAMLSGRYDREGITSLGAHWALQTDTGGHGNRTQFNH